MLSKIFGHKASGPTCPSCGTVLYGDETFCTNCGAPLQQASAPAVQTQDPADRASASGVPAAATCAQCGSKLYPGDAFCIMCGAPIAPQPMTASVTPQPAPVRHQPMPSGNNQGQMPSGLLTGALVPSVDVSVDDDPTVRPKLMRLPRDVARTGGVRQIHLDGCIYDVQIPAGVNGNDQLRIPGLGYYDDQTGVRGDLLIGFHLVDEDN